MGEKKTERVGDQMRRVTERDSPWMSCSLTPMDHRRRAELVSFGL